MRSSHSQQAREEIGLVEQLSGQFRRCESVFRFELCLNSLLDSQVTMRERWNSTETHATKPPTCVTAGGGLVPANKPQDWMLVDWKYSSAFSYASRSSCRR